MKSLPIFLLAATCAYADPQAEFYTREEIPLPPGEIMEIVSIATMPEQKIAVGTRRGDIWIVSGAYEKDLSKVKWQHYASGLHDPFGMFYQNGGLTLTQRPEITRVSDSDGDGLADRFVSLCSAWGLTADYHEYAFGSTPDRNGDLWVLLCLTGSYTADAPWRGWCVRVTPDGKMIPSCSGIRSPGGIGFNAEGDVFYTDNQGFWNGSSSLKWLKPGSFQGNPVGNPAHQLANLPAPPEITGPTRVLAERLKHPSLIPPAVIFPHGKVGQSPSGVACDLSEGKFGPFAKQLFVGEQTHSQVQRVSLEKINGIYQGAVYPFLSGFEAGLVPVCMDSAAGILFAGGTNRGWASRGSKPFTLERVIWTGQTPFEIETMSAQPDGFTLKFTQPAESSSAANPASYSMQAWTYIYQADYGSPEVDPATPTVTAAEVAADGLSVRLTVSGLVRGHVHHLHAPGLRSRSGQALWHPDAYYTLNEIPQ